MAFSRRNVLVGSAAVLAGGCATPVARPNVADPGTPIADVSFEVWDEAFNRVVDQTASPRLLSIGHQWAEGPAWDHLRQTLYFTDVPKNRAYSWSKPVGDQVFLDPSGIGAQHTHGLREPGANGLLLSHSGELLICNHGMRAVEAFDLSTRKRRVLTARYRDQRFNSPNDLIEASDGTIFFTDPPYGLEGLNASKLKEMAVNGVYRLSPDGRLDRLVDDMTFPNGVALSPDERWLYVSQSDPDAPMIRRFEIRDGAVSQGEEREAWFDAKPFMHPVGGLPDGMAVSRQGLVFLAGPGGVLIVDQTGACLGRIATGRPTANCAFGEDGKTLFITAADRLIAVRMAVMGLGRF